MIVDKKMEEEYDAYNKMANKKLEAIADRTAEFLQDPSSLPHYILSRDINATSLEEFAQLVAEKGTDAKKRKIFSRRNRYPSDVTIYTQMPPFFLPGEFTLTAFPNRRDRIMYTEKWSDEEKQRQEGRVHTTTAAAALTIIEGAQIMDEPWFKRRASKLGTTTLGGAITALAGANATIVQHQRAQLTAAERKAPLTTSLSELYAAKKKAAPSVSLYIHDEKISDIFGSHGLEAQDIEKTNWKEADQTITYFRRNLPNSVKSWPLPTRR